METALPFRMILNVVLSGVSEFDTSLMTGVWRKAEESRSKLFRHRWLLHARPSSCRQVDCRDAGLASPNLLSSGFFSSSLGTTTSRLISPLANALRNLS